MSRVSSLLILLAAACTGPDATDATDPAAVDSDGDGFDAEADCDDADESVFPGAEERCNGVDDDCDEEVDEEAVDRIELFQDSDGDGFGAPGTAELRCPGSDGWAAADGDCEDELPDVHPDAEEICFDGLDNDCDGEGCALLGESTTSRAHVTWPPVTLGVCVVASLDDDGLPDLVCGGSGLNSVRSPILPDYPRLDPIIRPFDKGGDEALGDFNGDGELDVLTAAGNLYLGPLGRYPDPDHTLTMPAVALRLQAADFDGDGRDDVTVLDTASGDWWVVSGTRLADAGALTGSALASGAMGHPAGIWEVADVLSAPGPELITDDGERVLVLSLDGSLAPLDGLGWIDLVGAPFATDSKRAAAVQRRTADTIVTELWPTPVTLPLTGEPTVRIRGGANLALTGADVDQDGQTDLIVTTQAPSYHVFYGPLAGDLDLADADFIVTNDLEPTGGGQNALVADFDGDGRVDVFFPALPTWGGFFFLGHGL